MEDQSASFTLTNSRSSDISMQTNPGISDENSSRCNKRTVQLTEVAPSNSSIVDCEDSPSHSWRPSLDLFSSKKFENLESQCVSRHVRSFYRNQDDLIRTFEDTQLDLTDDIYTSQVNIEQRKKSTRLAKISLVCNFLLLIAKSIASGLSGSLSVISSLVDSAVDLLSGIIIWWTSRAMKHRNPYLYPEGRSKLEPVAIVILSVVMTLASVQLIILSVQKIIALATTSNEKGPDMDIPTIVIISSTIVTKTGLFIACYRVKTPSTQVLAQDHRNDIMSNFVALACGYIGSRWWSYADPMGAMLISLYIAFSWWQTGKEQIKLLTGFTANPKFLQKITWLCLNHNSQIQQIDTVRAFHFGNNFIVEVDIVLPETMTLKEAHDIGEPLQQKLERMDKVERAFVHLDYEFTHDPKTEHKLV